MGHSIPLNYDIQASFRSSKARSFLVGQAFRNCLKTEYFGAPPVGAVREPPGIMALLEARRTRQIRGTIILRPFLHACHNLHLKTRQAGKPAPRLRVPAMSYASLIPSASDCFFSQPVEVDSLRERVYYSERRVVSRSLWSKNSSAIPPLSRLPGALWHKAEPL